MAACVPQHLFGVATLHQLRGRVGRNCVQAYAYLMHPPGLRAELLCKLEPFEHVKALGAGLQVARSDLEHRGAGNLFGVAQKGARRHVAPVNAVEYNLLLHEAACERGAAVAAAETITSRATNVFATLRGGGDAALDSAEHADVLEGVTLEAHGRNASLLAQLHPLPGDVHITFDEGSHSYTVCGSPIDRSVTAVVSALFEPFDPERCVAMYFSQWAGNSQSKYCTTIQQVRERGGTDAEAAAIIREGWETLGKDASRLGTALHLYAELDANRVVSDVPLGLRREVEQYEAFLQSAFVCDYGLQPYRTELAVAWCDAGRAVTAGQIDCLYRSRTGVITMVDFKRVSRHHLLTPWARGFGDAYGKPPVDELPDTPFWRYSLQQSYKTSG